MGTVAIRARGLGKSYRVGQVETGLTRLRRRLRGAAPQERIWAIRDLDFEIAEGDAVGLIGRNGAGKSTLLKVLSRVTEPTSGYADVAGRVGALLEVGTGFSPELTGRENIYLNGAILGMRKAEIDRKLDEIVAFADVARHIDTPVKWYSSGMFVRLGFAVAAHLQPEILVVDEVLAVGDAEFQKRSLTRMGEVTKEGRTILFVSHNMQLVRRLCRRALLLEHGQLVADGDVDSVVARYLAAVEAGGDGWQRWPAAAAPGDDDLRLREVTVVDEAGRPRTSFFSSKPIAVEVEFDLAVILPTLDFAIEVATVDGVVVFLSSVRDAREGQIVELGPGRNRLRCEFPTDLLNSGRYVINVRSVIHGIRWILNEDAVLHFDVIADHADASFLGAARPGVVAPAITWEAIEPTADDELLAVRVEGRS